MSTEAIEMVRAPAGMGRGYGGPVAPAALLLAEALAMSLRFDGATIRAAANAGWLSWLVSNSGTALALGMTGGAAALFFGGRRLREGIATAGAGPGRVPWPMLGLHLAAFSAFWRLTAEVMEGGAAASPAAPLWLGAWGLSGLAVAGSAAAAAFPPRAWGLLVRHGARAAAIGLIVGASATGAGLLARGLWRPMGHWTLEAVHGLLSLTGLPLVYDPSRGLVGTESFAGNIAPQCSGYEGIGLVWVFLAAYLWLDRRRLRFPRAWLLVPIGTAAIWGANVLRIAALILVGTFGAPEVAVGGFHSQAGWLGFNAVALGSIALARRSTYFRREGSDGPRTASGPGPEAVYLAPMLAIVAASMIGAAFSAAGPDRWYPIRLAAVAVPLWLYRREYAAIRWSCSWAAPAIGALVFALWVARWPGAEGVAPVRSAILAGAGPAWAVAWLVARFIGSAVTVPLAEELAFRGFLTRRLIAADFASVPPGRFTWTSFVLSSIAFGVLHDRWIEGTLAGMLYAYAYYRRGSLGDAVAAHATTNALLGADALITGDWSLFS